MNETMDTVTNKTAAESTAAATSVSAKTEGTNTADAAAVTESATTAGAAAVTESATISDAAETAPEPELIPSMDEFQDEIARSFHKLVPGDIVTGTVIGISETEVTLDLGSYAEGIIKLEELSNDPRFSIKADVSIGETLTATVLRENREGNILLSRKQADDVLAWDTLKEMMLNRTVAAVKVAQAVNGGVITYLHGIRAFIPASKLDVTYVESPEDYVGRELAVQVITADEENQKLVLSAKDAALEKAMSEKTERASRLQTGSVIVGTVEKIMPFGAFVAIGDGLSGLVHISQICEKRLKSPGEVLKVGDKVTVKILEIRDGKISLSIKAAAEQEETSGDESELPMNFSSGEEAVTGLGALLKGLKL